MEKDSKIYLAGHRGMVGAAIWRVLKKKGYSNLIGRTSKELDLRNQKAVFDFIKIEKPDVVIDAAARVGGILANNNYPFQFLMENMQIQNNLIDAAHKLDVKKFIFLGSSCIYPKLAPQPLKEEYLLTDSLEPTNEWYAIAKITGVKACQAIRKQFGKDFVSLMPTNLYGTHDNFDLETSHVLPAMIRKFHEAKINGNAPVTLWGSGKPMREFLFVDDMAEACIFIHRLDNDLFFNGVVSGESHVNVGTGNDVTIRELAETIKEVVEFKGSLVFDLNKPDGTMRKLLDVNRLSKLGYNSHTTLQAGLQLAYADFLQNFSHLRT